MNDRRSLSHHCIMLGPYVIMVVLLWHYFSTKLMLGLQYCKFLHSFSFCLRCLWSPRYYGHNLPKYLHGQFYSHKAIWRDKITQMSECLQNTVCRKTGYNMHGYNIPRQFQQATPLLLQEHSTKSNLLLVINNFPNQRVCLIKIRLQILILIGMKCCNIMHKALVKWQFT